MARGKAKGEVPCLQVTGEGVILKDSWLKANLGGLGLTVRNNAMLLLPRYRTMLGMSDDALHTSMKKKA